MNYADPKTITIKDFNQICRTCSSHDNINPIFDIYLAENVKAVDLLEYCLLLEVDSNDFLPQNICAICVDELFRIYQFKKQCHQNDSILKMILQNVESSEGPRKGNDLMVESKLDVKTSSATPIRSNEDLLDDSTKQTAECPKNFNSSSNRLKEHRRKSKNCEVRAHTCTICNRVFTRSKLKQHMRSHTKEKPYQCDICLQCFSMSGNLKRHIMTHTGERPHVCNICGKGFIQATSLHSHQKTHCAGDRSNKDDSGRFKCDFCGRGFKRLAPFNLHLKKHNPEHRGVNETKEEFVEGSKDHICAICQRGYKTKHLLKAHQLTHGEKTFLCSDCGKGFVTKAALQSHLKVHTGEKPHTCVICKKSFAHVGSFDSHMLIHSGQKPYSCTFCPKAFTQLSHLTYHLRTHSGERPYTCSFCGKSFALKGNMTVHVRTHTGETPYLCTVCGKGFYDSSSMKKHRRNHKDDDDFQTQPIPQLNFHQMPHNFYPAQ